MDLSEFKAEHAAIFNDAVASGVSKERDRVLAHLTMGEASGDLKTAITAIRDGSDMTQSLQATYNAASMNKADMKERVEDNIEAVTEKKSEAKSDLETVIEKMEALDNV